MKRCFLFIFLILIILCSCNKDIQKCGNTSDKIEIATNNLNDNQELMKAVWINYYELSMKNDGGGTQKSFELKISTMFKNLKDIGINTVIVHVRPFSDAFYKSSIYPYSKYITGTQGKDPNYDPLEIMCKQADLYGLKIHAWINPYRVLYSTNFSELDQKNPARIWKEDSILENDDWLIVTENGIYYNPSVPEVQKILIDGVREIIKKYDIDAIHMDDYFYPSTDENIDKPQYTTYLKNGGTRSLSDWRRDNVNIFVSGLYSAIKSENSNVKLGISPAGDIQKNYDTHYADIKEWVSNDGYVDYIMPQLYYGFQNETKNFDKVAKQWSELMKNSRVKICYGLAVYKCGQIDQYAGAGINEWKTNNDIISRQVGCLKKLERYDGIILYSYQYIFSENVKNEMKLLKNML
ncbi:MAG: family 10 glycosylhydrolase [Oscillospiraceae bacterium]